MNEKIKENLIKKYNSSEYTLQYINITNLIFNERCSIVSKFKDYLLYDDSTEFLRRYYLKEESNPRLKRIFLFYDTYSKIFPNYMILPENEYLYKNIRRKQKMIDAFNEIKKEEEENRRLIGNKNENNDNLNTEVFTQDIKNDIKNYNPSQTREEEYSFNNSISISIFSKKNFPSVDNSFIIENNINNLNYNKNDTNASIEKILNVMNGSKIYTNELKEGILIEEELKKKNQIERENQYLISPKKNKKFISKINNSHSLNSKNILSNITPTNLNKVISNLNNNNNQKENINIINNYQNIIIPKGNTIININNNYFQYLNRNNNNNNFFSPKIKKKNNTINTNSKKNKKKSKSPISQKIPFQLKILDNNKKKLMSPKFLNKKSEFLSFKVYSPIKTNITTPKNNSKLSEKINNSLKQCQSFKKINEKNNNLFNTIFQSEKEKTLENKEKKEKSKENKVKQLYKPKVIINKKEKELILTSKKKINVKNKIPLTEMKNKYKNIFKKTNQGLNTLKRNSCDNFLSETKSKNKFKEKYDCKIKKSNKSLKSQLNSKNNSILSQKIIMSPKLEKSKINIYNDFPCSTPIYIKVNRKNCLDNRKK